MAAIVARPPQIGPPPSPKPRPVTLKLQASKSQSTPVPNKRLQTLSPSAPPVKLPDTPPASPAAKRTSAYRPSLLYPPSKYALLLDSPPVYSIDANDLAAAVDHLSSQPLADPNRVFPWVHGLHPQNQTQLSFFVARRNSLKKTPKVLRGMTIVKAGGDLGRSRLKGAISPVELLSQEDDGISFLESDPRDGFSVRNFHIQACKMAQVSDIVVYGDDDADYADICHLAVQISIAQAGWRTRAGSIEENVPVFNTFVLSTPFRELEVSRPELVAVNSRGNLTGKIMDFFTWERVEMCEMSRASEIASNVWLGPTRDDFAPSHTQCRTDYAILIEASDLAQLPEPQTLMQLSHTLRETGRPQMLEFPSSGSFTALDWQKEEIKKVIATCEWIHATAQPSMAEGNEHEKDHDGDLLMHASSGCRILIHCTDGYTETTLLALIYFMYAEGVPLHDAWLQLHSEKERNFFAYPSDVTLLRHLQPYILRASPKYRKPAIPSEPKWLSRMDGSLPSRIVHYMYLGSLGHANNPELLRALGIGQILSVGETVVWPGEESERWTEGSHMVVNRVQDNGIDPLTSEFTRCLDFIERGRLNGTATLVHCRVGVSRSATICIAEIMKSLGLSFPRAYCFVRARRLNVIIQPHLRFAYELLKWEETLATGRDGPFKRELEWPTIAREIGLMNKPYSR